MKFDLDSRVYPTESLPSVLKDALSKVVDVFRTDSSYTDKRNEFAAAIISDANHVYAAGNFLSVNRAGQVESKECAEGTALAVARATEGPTFRLGAVMILNRVNNDESGVNGQTFGPCDRCQSSLIASTISVADRRAKRASGETVFPDDETLDSIPIISGVYDEKSPHGCDEVLVASLKELSSGDSVCYDTRQTDSAIPLRIQHSS